MSTIPYGRQNINQADIDAVIAVLRSDFLTQGPAIPAFEKKVSDYCGAKYALAVNSATSGLHIACLALGVGKDDIIWTSPITFVASANCALYCGATIDFVDIDPITYNLSIERLAEKLAAAEIVGKLPKVIIPVHLAGQSCDMAGIYALSQKYGFKIIEDASHAIGAKYGPKARDAIEGLRLLPVGNCRYSDITVFSFHPVKIITTGEGGILTTNNINLAKHLRLLRSHGISNVSADMYPRPLQEIWNYQQIDLGFNYRMTELQAALGVSQMNRLDEFVDKRQALARCYDEMLAELPLTTPWQSPDTYSSFHLYVVRLNLQVARESQKKIHALLLKNGIGANLHYIPVYLQPYYQNLGFKVGHCPEAEKYFHEAITLPMYPGLTQESQFKVVDVLRKCL